MDGTGNSGVRWLGCLECRDLACYASASAPSRLAVVSGAGCVVWSGPGLQRASSRAAVRFSALTPVGPLPQPGPVAGQRRARRGGGCRSLGWLCGRGGGLRLVVGAVVVGVDGADDAPADLAQLPGLGLGQRVEDQAADLLDVAGRGLGHLGPAMAGQGGQGVAAVAPGRGYGAPSRAVPAGRRPGTGAAASSRPTARVRSSAGCGRAPRIAGPAPGTRSG